MDGPPPGKRKVRKRKSSKKVWGAPSSVRFKDSRYVAENFPIEHGYSRGQFNSIYPVRGLGPMDDSDVIGFDDMPEPGLAPIPFLQPTHYFPGGRAEVSAHGLIWPRGGGATIAQWSIC